MGPLVATATGGLGSGMQQAGIEAQKRQRQAILNRQLDRTAAVQAKGAADSISEAQSMSPGARLAAMQAAEDATAAQTEKDLSGAGADLLQAGAGEGGAQSQAFMAAKADKALSEGNRLTALARAAAKTRSVGQTQQAETLRRSALAEALGSLYSTNRADAQAAGLDAEAVEMPWYGQVGQLVTTAGSAAMRGGSGTWSGR